MIIDFEIRWGAGRSGPVAIPPVDILPSPTLASGPPACLCALRTKITGGSWHLSN